MADDVRAVRWHRETPFRLRLRCRRVLPGGPDRRGDCRRSLVVCGLIMLLGCDVPGPVSQAADDDRFVSVMTRLVLIDTDPPRRLTATERQAAADSMRESVLAEYGITSEDLLRFADRAGVEPERMERLWSRISQAVDSAQMRRLQERRVPGIGTATDSAPAPAPAPPGTATPQGAGSTPAAGDPLRKRARIDSLRRILRAGDSVPRAP